MNRATTIAMCLALALGASRAQAEEALGGTWALHIEDLKHREIAVATIRFSGDTANSCMGGNWKRVIVESSTTKDEKFFPLSEPLSYSLDGSEITIGRMEICDAYLTLTGKLKGSEARGPYSGVGLGESSGLGTFTLRRNPAGSR